MICWADLLFSPPAKQFSIKRKAISKCCLIENDNNNNCCYNNNMLLLNLYMRSRGTLTGKCTCRPDSGFTSLLTLLCQPTKQFHVSLTCNYAIVTPLIRWFGLDFLAFCWKITIEQRWWGKRRCKPQTGFVVKTQFNALQFDAIQCNELAGSGQWS